MKPLHKMLMPHERLELDAHGEWRIISSLPSHIGYQYNRANVLVRTGIDGMVGVRKYLESRGA